MSGVTGGGVPRHAPGLRLEADDDGSRLDDASGRTVWHLNATAMALWELCDGETTVEEMVTAVGQLFSAGEEEVRHDVLLTFQSLTEAGLVRWGDPVTPERVGRYSP